MTNDREAGQHPPIAAIRSGSKSLLKERIDVPIR
jgi:hypothetical protein